MLSLSFSQDLAAFSVFVATVAFGYFRIPVLKFKR